MTFPKRVLIVENNYEEYYFFQFIILELTSDVIIEHQSSSCAAIKHLSKTNIPPYDIIFLNWHMPEITGRECLIGARLISSHSKVPIVVYSSLYEKPDYEEVMGLGAAYFFVLPENSMKLRDEVQKIFSLFPYFEHSKAADGFSASKE